MDESKSKEWQHLLGSIDTRRELDRYDERERHIEKNRQLYHFEELMRSVVVPTLRGCMLDLDRKGHFTRLRELSTRRARLDVQIHLAAVRRGAIEVALVDEQPANCRIDYQSGARRDHQVYPVKELTAAFVTDRVLHLVRSLVETA